MKIFVEYKNNNELIKVEFDTIEDGLKFYNEKKEENNFMELVIYQKIVLQGNYK